ncbi:ribonucleoside-diphosphate reductase [Terrihabitans sp. B22-R8]|uniref:ribonucleoside-diphosphate reductase n=1 Tax=Terrihabitans sp. B22-R8 TaxID=3425128 RepID=UPI00403CD171
MPLAPASSFRPLHPGMGVAVAERTYLRRVLTDDAQALLDREIALHPKDPDLKSWLVALNNTGGFSVRLDEAAAPRGMAPPTRWESWGELASRVAEGNVSLLSLTNAAGVPHEPDPARRTAEATELRDLIAKGAVLMSGRHLQQGDAHQMSRPQEVFTNCSTAATSFALFYLLLNGSGVGRCYDDDLMLTNWDHMPTIRVVLSDTHPDFDHSQHTSVRDARHLYGKGSNVTWFTVPDSREGWAEAVELLEIMTYQKVFRDHLLVLDFSEVRGRGEPIMGMQGRPSSGPVPLMNAFEKIAKIKGAGLAPWRQTLYIDHYLAEPVLVGGARRAARMSTKHWSDLEAVDFIEVKRPIEYDGLSMDQVLALREQSPFPPMAFLWSSNNSVTVDADFWRRLALMPDDADYNAQLTRHARAVFKRGAECAYGDGTGEPGFINEDLLVKNNAGLDADVFRRGDFVGSERYQVSDDTRLYLARLARIVSSKKNGYIVNPCGEIVLSVLGAFCVIADVAPFHCDTIEEAHTSVRTAVRALMRVNLMDSLYSAEVRRTNRIGVGLTGVHEFAWKFFGVGFRDLVAPDFEGYNRAKEAQPDRIRQDITTYLPRIRAAAFWDVLGSLSRVVYDEAVSYAGTLGVAVPHTMTTIKPSGSVSKLFGLTEGWHLPSMLHYLRWVQYRNDDPLVADYAALGYPVRKLEVYKGHTIVGFPTSPTICDLDGIEPHLVTAGEASMEEQFAWLRLGERFWLEGFDTAEYLAGDKQRPAYGNQISYTLKYRPATTGFAAFEEMLRAHQPGIRACSVMPQSDDLTAYEYLPEQPVSKAEFEGIARAIQRSAISEDIGREHLDCASGACPIEFREDGKHAA